MNEDSAVSIGSWCYVVAGENLCLLIFMRFICIFMLFCLMQPLEVTIACCVLTICLV